MNERATDEWRCPVAKAQTGMPTVCNHYIQAIKCFIAPTELKHNGSTQLKTERTNQQRSWWVFRRFLLITDGELYSVHFYFSKLVRTHGSNKSSLIIRASGVDKLRVLIAISSTQMETNCLMIALLTRDLCWCHRHVTVRRPEVDLVLLPPPVFRVSLINNRLYYIHIVHYVRS